jgi:monoterpene epsilon-lactone hydrolase
MVSPEALKLNEILRNAPKAVDMDLAHQREAGEHAEDMTSEPEGVRYEDAPEVEGLWATPQHRDGESAIVYLYGGGYVISSPHSRRKLAGHLANASSAHTLVPRYHLAPERPFPTAVEDAAADYRWLLGSGGRPERTVLAGDSSAGGLAVATMLKLREQGMTLPTAGVPISPWGRTLPAPARRSRQTPQSTSRRPRPACCAWPNSTFTGLIRVRHWPPPCTLTYPVYRLS